MFKNNKPNVTIFPTFSVICSYCFRLEAIPKVGKVQVFVGNGQAFVGKVQVFVGKGQVPSGSDGKTIRVVPKGGTIVSSVRVERMD